MGRSYQASSVDEVETDGTHLNSIHDRETGAWIWNNWAQLH